MNKHNLQIHHEYKLHRFFSANSKSTQCIQERIKALALWLQPMGNGQLGRWWRFEKKDERLGKKHRAQSTPNPEAYNVLIRR